MADEQHISLAIQRQIFVRRSESLVFEPPANFRVLRDPRVRLRPARSVHSISRITSSLIIRTFNAAVPAQMCVRFPAQMLSSPGADVRMGPGADVGESWRRCEDGSRRRCWRVLVQMWGWGPAQMWGWGPAQMWGWVPAQCGDGSRRGHAPQCQKASLRQGALRCRSAESRMQSAGEALWLPTGRAGTHRPARSHLHPPNPTYTRELRSAQSHLHS
jgi:hypothetical protein